MSEHRRILHDIHVLEQNIAHNYAELHRMRSINSRGGTISKRAFQEVESTIRQQETLLDSLVNTLNQVFDSELPEIPSYEEFRGGMDGSPPRRPPPAFREPPPAPSRPPPAPPRSKPKPTAKELQYREIHGKWPASYLKKIESYLALPLHLAQSEHEIKTFPPPPPPPPPPASATGDGKKLRFIKRYLKGQGMKPTKDNVQKVMDSMDAEGVVFE